MRIVVSAGDPSGDIRGGELLRELNVLSPVRMSGLGGECLRSSGASIVFDLEEYSVMGFTQVISSLGRIYSLRKKMREHIEECDPDIVLLIDYPGFNIPLAEWASQRGFRVVYYISPQLWAWGRGRVRKIRRWVDLMITLFHFEVDFYREHGVRAVCSGHPLADAVPAPLPQQLSGRIALLPGSRHQEISMLLPPMLDTFRNLRDQGRVFEAAVAVSGSVSPHLYRQAEETAGVRCTGSIRDALNGSSAAMVCSGTATLETAMWGTPFIVAYRTSAITYLLARLLVRGVKNIGMANIVAGEQFAREYIQGDASPSKMTRGLLPLLSDTEERRRVLEGTGDVRRALGPPGGSARAAEHILREYHEIS